jgi:hypothetical protein
LSAGGIEVNPPREREGEREREREREMGLQVGLSTTSDHVLPI